MNSKSDILSIITRCLHRLWLGADWTSLMVITYDKGYGKGMVLTLTVIGWTYLARCEVRVVLFLKPQWLVMGDNGVEARNEMWTVRSWF